MSLLKSLYTGVSGLSVNGLGLDIVSDNIANVNTIGFKRSRGTFQDILSQNLLGASNISQVGGGTQLQGIEQNFNQGSFQHTSGALDLAISGDGFFIVQGNAYGQSGNFYTRAGQFRLDDDGLLTTPSGLAVQGWTADGDGSLSGVLGSMRLAGSTLPPEATATVTAAANLNAEATVGAAFDPTDPSNTSNFSMSVNVYDSLGRDHQVEIYFRKNADFDGGAAPPTNAEWEYYALVDGEQIEGGTPGTPVMCASGSMEFDGDGALYSVTESTNDFDFVGAAADQTIAFDFGDAIADGGTGLSGCTQYGDPSGLIFLDQDGHTVGNLLGLQVMRDGRVYGTHSNGETRLLGQVALATFPSPRGLEKWGGNLWAETSGSGTPIVGEPGTGGRGLLSPNSLEQANVDLAEEFVSMISFQRGFQASSKSISTADQLLQEVVNLKR